MAGEKTLIKISDPKTGLTQAEYEAICRALGVTPDPPETTAPDDE